MGKPEFTFEIALRDGRTPREIMCRACAGWIGWDGAKWRHEDGTDACVQPEAVWGQMGKQDHSSLATICSMIRELMGRTPNLADKVEALNKIRSVLHSVSPFGAHPVDFVRWVPVDSVEANDYNPNTVAPPEMELLHISVAADGFTQPIVTNLEDETRVVIDGFHRNLVGRRYEDVAETLHGFLPVVQIRAGASDRSDRMASTIRHNRARGKHSVVKMTDIVLELKRRNWSDAKISKQLGMDADEVLRLSQIGGLADSFANRSFSMAWEVDGDDLETGDDDAVG